MPLSRLENFLVNTDGNILYVNPSDLDATDSFDNKGNSLTRPFVTIQRALLEAARFAYQIGDNNDRYDKTTILLYPGTHYIDNRPGYYVGTSGSVVKWYDQKQSDITGSESVQLTPTSVLDLNNSTNMLFKFNSVDGGVVVPKGTSIVGLDLRKTKVKPLYVPDPTKNNADAADYVPRSAIFRVTGGCYFWQFSIFDGDRGVYYNDTYTEKTNPALSHHKLTVFEYADGINPKDLTSLTDLQMYYYKVMNAYGDDTGERKITNYPNLADFQPNNPEFKIVGDLRSGQIGIKIIKASGTVATVETNEAHGLSVDDTVRISGISSDWYNGGKIVTSTGPVGSGIAATTFSYTLPGTPTSLTETGGSVIVETDNVQGASPYVFNCSLRSTYGMCGLHADGDKATGFKSMVVAQFTGIGLQKDDNAFLIYSDSSGDYKDVNSTSAPKPLYVNQDSIYHPDYSNYHIKASNSAFIQAVSVFAIGFSDHFLSDSGSDQSITNSNSNFGAKSLISKGFRKTSFGRDDTGYITHIVPPKDLQDEESNVIWRALDVKLMNSAYTSSSSNAPKAYLLGETDESNPPSNISNGYKIGARKGERIYLQSTLGVTDYEDSIPILMQSGDTGGSNTGEIDITEDGPSAEKRFDVNIVSDSADTLEFYENHNFINGESVRIYSDNGEMPDGLENETLYYVIASSSIGANKIKLAKSINKAASNESIDIKNTNGGIITVISRVTDKIAGESGHPIQWDGSNSNWFVHTTKTTTASSSTDLTNNQILSRTRDTTSYTKPDGTSSTLGVEWMNSVDANNSVTSARRTSENRGLSDRVYKLRYVVPKEYTGSNIAKAPEKNYVLQESSKNTLDNLTVDNLDGFLSNRNSRVISNITVSGLTATVTSEDVHKLSVGDRVWIRNVTSTLFADANAKDGYNGYWYVKSTPTTKTFTVNILKTPGTFTNNVGDRTTEPRKVLPIFSRNEYDTSYTIQDVETIQEYIDNQQDGIYYITCLIGNISPIVAPFTDKKFKQNIKQLYPTIDVDNQDNDPNQALSYASKTPIGNVSVNDSLNSITKEGIIEYLKDNRVGYAVTGAEGQNDGTSTIYTESNHNLNGITKLTLSSDVGTGYGNTTRYGVKLINQAQGTANDQGATAKVTSNASGNVTAVEIMDGGSAYVTTGAGSTLAIDGGDGNAVVSVTNINNVVGNVIQTTGIGTDKNRTDSGYNGLYKITSVPGRNSIVFDIGNTNAGLYTAFPQKGMAYIVDDALAINNISGVAATTLAGIATISTHPNSHGLYVGNKIKITGVNGTTSYNSDFIVQEVLPHPTSGTASTAFTIKTVSPRLPVPNTGTNLTNAELYRYPINATGEDSSFATEKISGRLLNLGTTIQTTATSNSGITNNETLITVGTTLGIVQGDYLQIDNEILRVKINPANATQLTVIRGVLGTKPTAHNKSSVIRKIKVIPSETRRFSSIRASGHTFEYLGYGPGNYSTAMPQKQVKTITAEQELLAISTEEKGGVVFYSGMNDRGEFFSGERVQPKENFLGSDVSDLTATFDDVYIRNTLRVGGGTNRLLPSEFRGPVNFTNKITSSAKDGIEAIKLLLKGNPNQKPSLQVGNDASPSLIVKEDTQNVGIKKANPEYELDVNGTVRANKYQNFALEDLPTPTNSDNGDVQANTHNTFYRNRFLKVNDRGSSYELVDAHEVDSYALRSFGISNDPTIYAGTGSLDGDRLKVSGISTSKMYIGQKVKLFGVTKWTGGSAPTDTLLARDAIVQTVGRSGTDNEGTGPTCYNYWVAQYNLRDGRVGVASCVNALGVGHTLVSNMNDGDFIKLTLNRQPNNGLLIYRHTKTVTSLNFVPSSPNAAFTTFRQDAKLIAILGSKELGSQEAGIEWKDYGTYSQTTWAKKGTENEFLPCKQSHPDEWDGANNRQWEGTTNPDHQIHFPNVPTNDADPDEWDEPTPPFGNASPLATGSGGKGHRRGWSIDEIVAIGENSITVEGKYSCNDTVGFGTGANVKVVHDNTAGFRKAISSIQSTGGSYLNLPSGTYYTNELLIPSGFTLAGNGKNSVVTKQFFASDEKDGWGPSSSEYPDSITGGIEIKETGNFVGIGTTMTTSYDGSKDVTVSNLTLDGNSINNVNTQFDNSMIYSRFARSMLIKDVEIRNGSGDGLYMDGSERISVENSTFVDGCLQDDIPYRPLVATASTSVRVNDCLFENYPGSIDLTACNVVATGGNIIRNCGTGIDAYATGKVTTTNNILLGPSDEWLPSSDIYDSDWNSINLNVNITDERVGLSDHTQTDFEGPTMLYLENGEPKNISSPVQITAGIGTMVNLNKPGVTPGIGPRFVQFSINTPDGGTLDGFDRENGYFRLSLTAQQVTEHLTENPTGGAGLGEVGISTPLGYNVLGVEWLDKPVGYATYIGIGTGRWGTSAHGSVPGVANTCYYIEFEDSNQFPGVSVGDYVQLMDHQVQPPLANYKFVVDAKNTIAGISTMRLKPVVLDSATDILFPQPGNTTYVPPTAPATNGSWTGAGIGTIPFTSQHVGFETTGLKDGLKSGYISIRRSFTIAKGRVGVS